VGKTMTTKGMIHSIETFGTVDGPGIRYVIFFQGCPLRCQYCHNRDTWNIQDGKEVTVDELIADIKKYIPFMKSSGGGVTISGGEPTLQIDFLRELLKALKKLGIHTCIDTSGFVHLEKVQDLLDYVDLVLLDLKHIDPEKHLQITGVPNNKILEFARHLSDKNIPMWIRHVVVPTLTDDPQDVQQLADFINTLENVEKVELLPYHSMGKIKWKKLHQLYPLDDLRDANDYDLQQVSSILLKNGIHQAGSGAA